MQVYFNRDCDLDLLKEKTVTIVGYGNQGSAHAANLKDSGVGRVIVALREGSRNRAVAAADGFDVMAVAEAASISDIVMMLIPDEEQASVYTRDLVPNMKKGSVLAFAHGLNIHFGLIKPREDLDVIMVAPKGPGHQVRSHYLEGRGLVCLVAVHQDISGRAFDYCLAYGAAIGGGRAGIMKTDFAEECVTDLFGEQAVLCGGLPALINAGFETLVEAGYAPEVAYFECLHEVKLITDLLYERGLSGMRQAISNTAEYGGYKTGEKLINGSVKEAMKKVLKDIEAGQFTKDFVSDCRAGSPEMSQYRRQGAEMLVEKTGETLRAQLPGLYKHSVTSKKAG